MALTNRLVLQFDNLDEDLERQAEETRSPTMTLSKASGLPQSLVSKDRKRSSPVLIDNVSCSSAGVGISPALAAFRRAFSHAATFAAYPSGFVCCCSVKSE